MVTAGKERFKIVSVKQEKPVLVCEVELLEEEDDSSPEACLHSKKLQCNGALVLMEPSD